VTGITLILLASLVPGEGIGSMDDLYCSTFSIAAVDTATGECGVAVASRVLAVGHIVPWAEPGAGAVATQALANAGFGPAGLDLLAGGMAADDVLDSLLATDPGREERQLGVVDASGRSATFTGTGTMEWAGGVSGPGYAIQGNILTGPEVVAAMEEAFLSTGGPLPWRLLRALAAGDAAGGDSRGRQSAALLVVRAGGGYQGAGDRLVDIRIDDNPDPVTELARVYSLWEPAFAFAVYLDAGTPADGSHALDIMERALAAGIRDAETLNSFAWTLAERGLFPERALELALEAHSLAPDDANIMDTLAQAYFSAGQYANAVTWEQEALRREPGSTFFQEQMRRFQEALDATGRAPLPILEDGE
jgi:uncharacterized Ntn-hydrolase superfamily protein